MKSRRSGLRRFSSDRRRRIRRQLLRKYGPYCQICLLKGLSEPEALIDLELEKQEGRSWSIDHIIPRSRGGKDEIDNLQPTHYECNHSRGNMSLADAVAAA